MYRNLILIYRGRDMTHAICCLLLRWLAGVSDSPDLRCNSSQNTLLPARRALLPLERLCVSGKCGESASSETKKSGELLPAVFTLALGWHKHQLESEDRNTLHDFMMSLPREGINVLSFFDADAPADATAMAAAEVSTKVGEACGDAHTTHSFDGFVAYYGSHYSAYWRSDLDGSEWVSFDDKTVRAVGDWNAIVENVKGGLLMPQLLFFGKHDPAQRDERDGALERTKRAGAELSHRARAEAEAAAEAARLAAEEQARAEAEAVAQKPPIDRSTDRSISLSPSSLSRPPHQNAKTPEREDDITTVDSRRTSRG